MEIRIPRPVVADIHAHARETYPEECCGFLLGAESGEHRIVAENRRARNVHPDSRRVRYTIDPHDVLRIVREVRGDVQHIGFYHSHVDGPAVPSTWDLERAWPYYVYTIVPVDPDRAGELTGWILDDGARAFRPVAVRVGP